MSNLESLILTDCLDVVCAIYGKQRNEMMTDSYFDALSDLDGELVVKAFRAALDDPYFPKPARIRELVTGVTADADWHTIMAVASGTTKSATISGISAIALTTATSTNSTLAALKKISFCDDSFQLREIRKDWVRYATMPQLGSGLPPSDVIITLAVEAPNTNFEYPSDDNFSFRTASMIRCIKEKGSVSVAWLPIIDKFPVAKKREIMEAVEVNGWGTPALKESSLYRKYRSIADAMTEIDESSILDAIAASRGQGGV